MAKLSWGMIGGGLLTSIAGGYFTLSSQKNLQMAIAIFQNLNGYLLHFTIKLFVDMKSRAYPLGVATVY